MGYGYVFELSAPLGMCNGKEILFWKREGWYRVPSFPKELEVGRSGLNRKKKKETRCTSVCLSVLFVYTRTHTHKIYIYTCMYGYIFTYIDVYMYI